MDLAQAVRDPEMISATNQGYLGSALQSPGELNDLAPYRPHYRQAVLPEGDLLPWRLQKPRDASLEVNVPAALGKDHNGIRDDRTHQAFSPIRRLMPRKALVIESNTPING